MKRDGADDDEDEDEEEDAMAVEGGESAKPNKVKPANTYDKVVSQRYGRDKAESWWLVLGDTNTNALLSIKRLVVTKQSMVR